MNFCTTSGLLLCILGAIIGLAVSNGGYELPQLLGSSVPVLYAASALAFVAAAQAQSEAQSPKGAE